MLGKTDYDILTKEDADKITAIKRRVLDTGEPAALEAPLTDSTGALHYFEGSYFPTFDEKKKISGLIGYFRNATSRKQIEKELAESEEKFRMLAESSPYAILMHQGGRWIYANPAAYEISGYTKDEAVNMNFWDIVHPEHREMVMQSGLNRQQGENVKRNYQFKILAKNDVVKWVSLTGTLISYKNKPTVLITIADITESKLAEEQLMRQAAQLQERSAQLEEINKELESFSYSVSHDLRSPLRAIDGYSRMILKQGDKFDEETVRKFNAIRGNIQQMGQLIDGLLNFSRLGKQEMKEIKLDMAELASDVWKELELINPGRAIKLNVKNMPDAYGDRLLIKQVYLNLLGNAVKFTKLCAPAQIEVNGYTRDKEHIYYIRDNGAGFDMAYYDKLFGMFQRLHSADDFEGTGIGLAIVQRIIHKHGGRVWAEGENNKGATFYFTLPVK